MESNKSGKIYLMNDFIHDLFSSLGLNKKQINMTFKFCIFSGIFRGWSCSLETQLLNGTKNVKSASLGKYQLGEKNLNLGRTSFSQFESDKNSTPYSTLIDLK